MDDKKVKYDALDAMWAFVRMGGYQLHPADISSLVSLYPCRLAWLCGRSMGFCGGIRKAARHYLRAAMRSNMDLCGF